MYVERVPPNGESSRIAGSDAPAPWAGGAAPVSGSPQRATAFPLGGATRGTINLEGLAADASGNVYIADTGLNLVLKVTPDGMLTVVGGTGEPGLGDDGQLTPGPARHDALTPWGIATERDGNVYTGVGAVVVKIAPTGALSIVAGNGHHGKLKPGPAVDSPLGYVWGLAVDGAGDLYISDDNGIQRVDPTGRLSEIPHTSGNDQPGGALAVSNSGDLYYAAGAGLLFPPKGWTPTIRHVSPNGTQTIVAKSTSKPSTCPLLPCPSTRYPVSPISLAVSPDGRGLYIGQGADGQILKLTFP